MVNYLRPLSANNLYSGDSMKIKSLYIDNFRGISMVSADNLGDTIIIAGQNGSGKSCIFDAVRLLKSTYGGYQQNEWQHFFGEFAIQLHGGEKHLRGLFNDSRKNLIIQCEFQLREKERAYISENSADLLEAMIWQNVLPEAFQYGGYRKALFSNQFRERQPEVDERVRNSLPVLSKELAAASVIGRIEVNPAGQVTTNNCLLLSVVFSNFRPRKIGVIDFHGAQRHYGRENVQGINLSLDQANQKYSQHTLYNYNNKYNNVKSEMAGDFIKELLAEKAGPVVDVGAATSLSSTLKELFESFFPDKKFLGPRPTLDGSLSFPVVTQNGAEHDLDELSSGEKEILYGYLRIRSSAPRDSIILLDEPELHLNPRLIRGLPEFYRKHLGEALDNQIWLVTHSDALIREAVGKPGFNVFHMLPCGMGATGGSQLRSLSVQQDLEMVIADLVGDLAAYRPGGKGLIFEGGGDSDFDKTFVATLFAEEVRGINLISGSNKARVRLLHDVLAKAYERGDLPTKFYAIVDSDSDNSSRTAAAVYCYEWDVYHIENYLLEPRYIASTLNALALSSNYDEDGVSQKLRSAALLLEPAIVAHKLRGHVNERIVSSIDLGFDPRSSDLSGEMYSAATRSQDKIRAILGSSLSLTELQQKEGAYRSELENSFNDGTWIKRLPGRDILKQLLSGEKVQITYEIFRNLILAKMASDGYKPAGMKAIIDKIASD